MSCAKLRRVWQIKAASPEEAGAARAEFPVAGHRNMCHRKPRMSRCADCWPPEEEAPEGCESCSSGRSFSRSASQRKGGHERVDAAALRSRTCKCDRCDGEGAFAGREGRGCLTACPREGRWLQPAGSKDCRSRAAPVFNQRNGPEERLEDLGGVDEILLDLRQLVVQPLSHPEVFQHLGVQPPTGVLLFGPPGCGKTKIAHAIAGTTGVPFFKIAATEIVSGMSGESEAKIRQLFQAAMAAAPSLIFLDEVDAITPKRDSAGREMERRIVAQLLTCLDELQKANVVVLGATNRPDALDPALRRAGRFDREIAMGIPDEAARARILEKMVMGMRLAENLDLQFLAKKTAGFVGADLSALTKEAALGAVQRAFSGLQSQRSEQSEAGEATESSEASLLRPYTAEEMANLAIGCCRLHGSTHQSPAVGAARRLLNHSRRGSGRMSAHCKKSKLTWTQRSASRFARRSSSESLVGASA